MSAPLLRDGTIRLTTPQSGGTGTVRAAMRSGVRRAAESSAPVPVPSSPSYRQAFMDRLQQPHLEMPAWPGAVTYARRHARAVLWDIGLKELIEPVELVVSELVTNAVRVSGGLDSHQGVHEKPLPAVCLWLVLEHDGVLVLVSDSCPLLPKRQAPGPDDDSGRGLLLVELFSAAWGCFEFGDQIGKVVWAMCQG